MNTDRCLNHLTPSGGLVINRFRILILFVAVVFAAGSASADDFIFSLYPSAAITGQAGQTIGWGYSITNGTGYWLVCSSVVAPLWAAPVDSGSADVFDAPIVAPYSNRTVSYGTPNPADPTNSIIGLYEITFASDAHVGDAVSGSDYYFEVYGDFYGGDQDGPNYDDWKSSAYAKADFSATVVPEPAELLLLAIGLGAVLLIGWRVRA